MVKDRNRLLQGVGELCEFLGTQQKVAHAFIALGLPLRKVNGRYYAHSAVVDSWLQWFLNPTVSGGAKEVFTTAPGKPGKERADQ